MGKETIKVFYTFCHKFENRRWLPFLGRVNFFGKLGKVVCLHTQRNCSILHSYQAFLCFAFVDQKFWQNRSVTLFLRYKHFLCYAIFAKN